MQDISKIKTVYCGLYLLFSWHLSLCGNRRVSYRETRRGTLRFFCSGVTEGIDSVALCFTGDTLRRQKNWVVYAKRPFGGPKQVIEYLGRYTHKIAISNHRLQNVDQANTTFSYKDYKSNGGKKQMTLSNEEFIRRFAMHILPLRYVRIRHYGILSSTWKRAKFEKLRAQLKMPARKIEIATKLHACPCCKTGTLITLITFGKRGPPEQYKTEEKRNA